MRMKEYQMKDQSSAIALARVQEKIEKAEDKDKEKDKVKVMVTMPFDSENFIKYWTLWKDYKKKQFKFTYATPQSEQASINDLVKLSDGNEQTALKIIEQSLAKGWKGFFELKNEQNGNNKTGTKVSHVTEREFIETAFKRNGGW
jgi:hypothetical protein